jgi:HK97 gp10 family phage protein
MVATKSTFQLEGVEDLVKQLRKLRGTAIRKVYRQAVREAARPVLATAKQIVPVDTGRLKRSLKIRAGRRSRRIISVVVKPGTRSELGIAPDASGYYPAHIELGFRRGTTKFPGNRFLRDAILLERADAIRIISARVKEGIKRASR